MECGPRLAAAFLEAKLVDELILYVAPLSAGRGCGAADCPQRVRLRTGSLPPSSNLRSMQRIGEDLRLLLTPRSAQPEGALTLFTGIIVATGRLVSIVAKGGDLELGVDAAALDAGRLALGDSVSVQGVCLTVTRFDGPVFYADVSRETLAKTTLGKAQGRGALELGAEPARR